MIMASMTSGLMWWNMFLFVMCVNKILIKNKNTFCLMLSKQQYIISYCYHANEILNTLKLIYLGYFIAVPKFNESTQISDFIRCMIKANILIYLISKYEIFSSCKNLWMIIVFKLNYTSIITDLGSEMMQNHFSRNHFSKKYACAGILEVIEKIIRKYYLTP